MSRQGGPPGDLLRERGGMSGAGSIPAPVLRLH